MSQIQNLGAGNGGGGANTFVTDAGNAVPAAGIINILGSHGINTAGAGNTVTIAINNAITLGDLAPIATGSSALTATTGDITITSGNFNITSTTSAAGADGVINMGAARWIHNFGTQNTFVGKNTGNFTLTIGSAVQNVAVGENALISLTTSTDNTAIGKDAMFALQGGAGGNVAVGKDALTSSVSNSANTAIGYQSLFNCISNQNTSVGYSAAQNLNNAGSTQNVAIGFASLFNATNAANNISIGGNQPLLNLLTGSNNIAILQSQTGAYVGAESSNILIGNSGTAAESNAIHIGTTGSGASQQNKCFIGGINGVTASNAVMVTINSATDQLGVTAIPSGNISITGDSGGALSSNAFTFTGGSTGLTFAGAGTTETLGGTLAIANGGTNATSMSTSTGIVKYDGTRLVTSSTALIDSSNRYTNTAQPAFLAYLSATTANDKTGDGTAYTVICDTEVYDQGSNYNNGTGIFTAPVTGRYWLSFSLKCQNIVAANQTQEFISIVTTARTYVGSQFGSSAVKTAGGNITLSFSVLADMSATDTATFTFQADGSIKNIGVVGGATLVTFVSGYLAC